MWSDGFLLFHLLETIIYGLMIVLFIMLFLLKQFVLITFIFAEICSFSFCFFFLFALLLLFNCYTYFYTCLYWKMSN